MVQRGANTQCTHVSHAESVRDEGNGARIGATRTGRGISVTLTTCGPKKPGQTLHELLNDGSMERVRKIVRDYIKISSSRVWTVDVLDFEFLSSMFPVRHLDFFLIVLFLSHVIQEFRAEPWFDRRIAIMPGQNFGAT